MKKSCYQLASNNYSVNFTICFIFLPCIIIASSEDLDSRGKASTRVRLKLSFGSSGAVLVLR